MKELLIPLPFFINKFISYKNEGIDQFLDNSKELYIAEFQLNKEIVEDCR